jgi:type IV pilus assembly protein PilE
MEKHMNYAKQMKHTRGFTLIEIMIVVAIVAIIASIAVPQYSQYVMRGRLVEATANLGQLRIRAEQWFQDNRTYAGMDTAPQPANGCMVAAGDAKYFGYSCSVAPSANGYTIQALGIAAQGTGGFTFTVDQTNAKNTIVTPPAPSSWMGGACWVSRPGGC